MTKPIIFFSHSSKDKAILSKLKKKIDRMTGNSIDIFLSSDGQSIPFGRNWVSKMEEALNSASLMFVFVSPNSLTSNWIYFEAGHAYSKDIDVVPVGIMGIDLGSIQPPLGLLQGFNLDKKDALANIISIINKTCETSFEGDFEEEAFNQIFTPNSYQNLQTPISSIEYQLISNSLELGKLAKQLQSENIECNYFENLNIRLPGMTFSRINPTLNEYKIIIDGLLFEDNLHLLDKYLPKPIHLKGEVLIYFEINYHLNSPTYDRQTALLKDTKIMISDKGGQHCYKNINFHIAYFRSENKFDLRIDPSVSMNGSWIKEVVNLLVENKLIVDLTNI